MRERKGPPSPEREFLLQLSDALRSASDPDEIQRVTTELLCRHLGLARCGYGEIDAAGEVVTIRHEHRERDVPPMAGRLRMSGYGHGVMEAFRDGQTLVIEDVASDPEIASDFAILATQAAVEAPLVKDGRFTAIIFCHQDAPRAWSAHEIELIEEVAERTWAVVERARSEEALRESEARNAFLLELTDTLRAIDDPDEVAYRTAEALGRFMGIARCVYGTFHASGRDYQVDRDWTDGRLESIAGLTGAMEDFGEIGEDPRAGRTLVIEDAAHDARTAGSEGWAEVGVVRSVIAIPLVTGGSLRAGFAVHDTKPRQWSAAEIELVEQTAKRSWDLVDSARTRQALKESERHQAFLLTLSDALRPLSDAVEIRLAATRVLGEHFGASRAYYFGYDEETTEGTVLPEYLRDGTPSIAGIVRISDFPNAQKFLAHSRFVVPDIANEPEFSDADRAGCAGLGIAAYMQASLIKNGQLIAALAVNDSQPRAWTDDDARLVQDTAERTWAAVEWAQAQDALRVTETRARLALDAAGAGSWVWYPDTDDSDRDARLIEMFGLPADEPLGLASAIDRVIIEEDRAPTEAAVLAALDPSGDGTLNIEMRIRRPDGEDRVLLVQAQTEFGGEPRRALRVPGVTVDLTGLRRAEEEARRKREAHERRDREFVANAAHELRTPLAGIIGAVDALDAGAKEDPEQRERFLAHVRGGADRLTRLSESLLWLAQAENGGKPPQALLDLETVLRGVAAELEPRPGVTVEVQAPPGLQVISNLGLVERVLANLGENAAIHTERGRIELAARQQDGEVIIEVSDTGPSIDPELLEHAFDRFSRGHAGKGFGLGLAIAAQSAAAVGGALTLEPGPEIGTVARLVLPREMPS